MSYRPICDTWILARSKTKYYGSYPAGFLHRARALLGVGPADSVLHICGGKVREYPYRGFGPNDRTLDLDPACQPDFLQDCRDPLPLRTVPRVVPTEHIHWDDVLTRRVNAAMEVDVQVPWDAVLIDRPYTSEDAAHYAPGAGVLPDINDLLKRSLGVVPPGHRVGVLDYLWPHPGKVGLEVAVVAVGTGRNGRARWFTVFERI